MEKLIADAGRDNPAAWMDYGWVLYRHGRVEEAHQWLARTENSWAFERWPYAKFGQYHSVGEVPQNIVYFDEYRVAGPDGSYAAVAPPNGPVPTGKDALLLNTR